MRPRLMLVFGVIAALAVTGCSASPIPEPTEAGPSPSPSASPSPTEEPIVEPEIAFDVTCADVAAGMSDLVAVRDAPVREILSTVSAPNWYPGPAQYMFPRSGGVVCSQDDGEQLLWEIAIIPNAQFAVDGLVEQGYEPFSYCDAGGCQAILREGDVLVSGSVSDPSLTAADAERVNEALRRLAIKAVASQREVEMQASDLAGVGCERLLTAEELSQAWEIRAEMETGFSFGGWGVPAHTYLVVGEAPLCYYSSAAGSYEADPYLTITGLPAGAWAFDLIEGRTPVVVPGVDRALSGVEGSPPFSRQYLDLLVGADWIRLTTYDDGDGSHDLMAIAPQVVEHLATGRPAPQ